MAIFNRYEGNAPMAISMYQASVPVFTQMLNALAGVLDKAEAHCTAKKIDPSVLLSDRLYPDMFPLSRQVQLASTFAAGASARLAGVDVPVYEDSEKTVGELKARIKKAVDFMAGLKPQQIDGSEEREITLTVAGNPRTFKGQTYLLNFAQPHFYFHCTTAYDILRHNGVEVGKRDYLGKVPGF